MSLLEAEHADDTVIQVEVIDAAGNDAVANIAVRLNQTPMVTGTELRLTIGTQDAESPDGDYFTSDNPTEAEPDFVNNIVCDRLNACTIKLEVDDDNLQDMFKWQAHTDSAFVVATPTDDGVMLVGQPNQSGDATVYVWAVRRRRLADA